MLHGGYHLNVLEDGDSGRSLDQVLSNFFPKGSIIEVKVTAKSTGESRGLCQFKQKYGVCGDVLNADGKCQNEEHNEQPSLLGVEA
jgi:hypothetical protein